MADGRRATKEGRDEQILLTAKRVWDLPLSSARDLEGYGDFALPQIDSLLGAAVEKGLIGFIRVGQSLQVQRRYYLHRKGIDSLQDHFGLPVTWQVTETAMREHVRRLRLYEPICRLMPTLFRTGAVRVPEAFAVEPGDDPHEVVLDESVTLDGFTWIRDIQESLVHAIARYRTAGGDQIWIPVITVGLHHGDIPRPRDLAHLLEAVDTIPDFRYGLTPASPPGLLFVVLDRLAGLAVRLSCPPHLPKGIVDAEGHVIERLDPVTPAGRVLEPGVDAETVGYPEQFTEWFRSEAGLAAMQGVPQRRVFEWVNNFPGSGQKAMASGVGHPPSKVKKILESFGDVGLVAELDKRPYLESKGRRAAARRDRQHPNAVHNRFGIYTDPDSPYRHDQREHDHGVARLAAMFRKAGIRAEAGWRLEIIYDDGIQVRPDLWVLIPTGDGWGMWHALEYERSARAESQAERKLRPYRRARDRHDPWPMLMVCGQGKPGKRGESADRNVARNYLLLSDDLPVLVMPTHEAFNGKLVLPGNTWLRMDVRVPITHLIDSTARDDLLERIDTTPGWAQLRPVIPGSGEERVAEVDHLLNGR